MDQLLSRGADWPGLASRETMERIRRVFANSLHLNCSEKGLTYEEMLDEAVSLDSIAVLDFLTALEKEFGVELDPAGLEFEFLRDIAGLVSYIEDRFNGASGVETDDGSIGRTSE